MTLPGILEQLGVGGIFGAIVGYTAKKATKAAAVILGLAFILIQVLAYYHLVTPHWDRIGEAVATAQPAATPVVAKLMKVLTHNLPFGGSFLAGFFLGFKHG